MKADAVFQGGGLKAIGYVGAASRFEEYGYTWEKLAGTSAGAVVAALLASNYKAEDLKKIMLSTNYPQLLDRTRLGKLPIMGGTLSVLFDKGLYSGDGVYNWIKELLKAKGVVQFKDISANGKSRLKIIASDVTNKSLLVLPEDIIRYGINPMELEVAKAVRMSISIPLYFKPVYISYNGGGAFIVDGGITSNFPVWLFDVDGIPKWPTFGFKFDINKKYKVYSKNSFINYLMDLGEALVDSYDEACLQEKDAVRTVPIPSLDVKTTDFGITKEKSMKLLNSGYTSADEFLKHWNFRDYVRKYRSI
jgi:NTE family protein